MRHVLLQKVYVTLIELESFEKEKDFVYTSEKCKLAFKGTLSEVGFKRDWFVLPATFPVGVGHRDLVLISEEWVEPVVVDFVLVAIILGRLHDY